MICTSYLSYLLTCRSACSNTASQGVIHQYPGTSADRGRNGDLWPLNASSFAWNILTSGTTAVTTGLGDPKSPSVGQALFAGSNLWTCEWQLWSSSSLTAVTSVAIRAVYFTFLRHTPNIPLFNRPLFLCLAADCTWGLNMYRLQANGTWLWTSFYKGPQNQGFKYLAGKNNTAGQLCLIATACSSPWNLWHFNVSIALV